MTINSGGEKIFAEEVEQAIAHHPDVYDVVCAGRPSSAGVRRSWRWCSSVTGATTTEDELLAEAASHVARYKLPKAFVFRDDIVRSPAGKADYRWAKEQVDDSTCNPLDTPRPAGRMPACTDTGASATRGGPTC